MTRARGLRKALLVAHISFSVGWLGAVVAFLILAVVAIASPEPKVSRSLYIAMDVLGRFALAPLAVLALASGLWQSLSSSWGLFRHWWVIVKLILTLVSLVVLMTYAATLARLADAARTPETASALLPSASPVVHAAAATVVLTGVVWLSVFKPKGLTRYGWRRQRLSTTEALPSISSESPQDHRSAPELRVSE